jgi:pilus assembly protein Flp/PilA
MRVESPCSENGSSTRIGYKTKNNADKDRRTLSIHRLQFITKTQRHSRIAGQRQVSEALSRSTLSRATKFAPAFRCVPASESRATFVDFSRGIMNKLVKRFLIEDRGVTAIEYALIAGLIAAAIATVVGSVSTNIQAVFTTVAAAIKT